LDETYAGGHFDTVPGEYTLLTVSDTGIGMGQEVKARIFEPFFTTKEAHEGTGLGLATVFGIVKQSGGHIQVYSEEGIGTTFKVYLPRAEAVAPVPCQQHQPDETMRGTETILVVEDDLAIQSMTATFLKEQGYKTLTATNGQEAVNLYQQYQDEIQLVLTDLVMPHMDGITLINQLQAIQADVKILLTSGYTNKAITNRELLESNTAFIQKPYSLIALAHKIRQVLRQCPENNCSSE
jgi:CheY-like chemotaxis protein